MKKIGLTKLMNSSKGKIIFSIILGFGIATLFRKVCKDRNCIVFKAPELNNIVDGEKDAVNENGDIQPQKINPE
jgi:hypothetical protein